MKMVLETDIMLLDSLVLISLSFPYPHDPQPRQPNSVASG